MDLDRNGAEVLDRDECLRLLRSVTVGRVAVHSGALPTVVPVNFLVADDEIVFRTGTGTKLEAATSNAVVAFEVDDIDPFNHTGWSVVATGVAEEVTDPDGLARLRRLPIAHWTHGPADRYVHITPTLLTGRRLPGDGAGITSFRGPQR